MFLNKELVIVIFLMVLSLVSWANTKNIWHTALNLMSFFKSNASNAWMQQFRMSPQKFSLFPGQRLNTNVYNRCAFVSKLEKMNPQHKADMHLGLPKLSLCYDHHLLSRSTQSLMFARDAPLRSETLFTKSMQMCNFIKKEPPTQVFSCEFCKILRKSIKNASGRLSSCCNSIF